MVVRVVVRVRVLDARDLGEIHGERAAARDGTAREPFARAHLGDRPLRSALRDVERIEGKGHGGEPQARRHLYAAGLDREPAVAGQRGGGERTDVAQNGRVTAAGASAMSGKEMR